MNIPKGFVAIVGLIRAVSIKAAAANREVL